MPRCIRLVAVALLGPYRDEGARQRLNHRDRYGAEAVKVKVTRKLWFGTYTKGSAPLQPHSIRARSNA